MHAETEKATILVVDDAPENLALMLALLKDDYTVRVANNGERALSLLQASEIPPDLLLLDIMMPGIDGYEVCRRIKSDEKLHELPVIFLTALSANTDEQHGLELGAVDYITKPINPAIFMARIKNHIELSRLRHFLEERNLFLKDRNEWLEREVSSRTEEISALQEAVVYAVASIVETRDKDTGGHVLRTQHYVRALAKHLCDHPCFAEYLSGRTIDMLFKSAPIHDIGKVGIPDSILNKPGKLTAEEIEVMRQHPQIGERALCRAEEHAGKHFDFLDLAKEITLSHHERWDGGGYPERLQGEAIPISARLMALADVYDVVTSRRVYKEAKTHEQAVDIISRGRNTDFDPAVVDAFLACQDEFKKIAQNFPG